MRFAKHGLSTDAERVPPGEPFWVLHVDMDQFVAAVEVRRRPELSGRPVVVGGDGDPTRPRQVVATATYQARAFGVSSGMPLWTAARRCPGAVFLPTDPPAYEQASAQVMDVLRGFPAIVEVAGWDEAFLATRTDDPEAAADLIRGTLLVRTGLTCSVGIGDNKQRAKLASGFAKPSGVSRLTEVNWNAVMGDRPTEALWGVGAKTSARLAGLGLRTVAELAAADPAVLAGHLGPTIGPWHVALARGGGYPPVTAQPFQPRSISRETTYPVDLVERSDIRQKVVGLAADVLADVVRAGRTVAKVEVKVRSSAFRTATRVTALRPATTGGEAIERTALAALDRFPLDRPVRLLGVRLEFAPRAEGSAAEGSAADAGSLCGQ